MAENMEELEAQLILRKVAFEEKRLEVNLGKTKVMETSGASGVVVVVYIFGANRRWPVEVIIAARIVDFYT